MSLEIGRDLLFLKKHGFGKHLGSGTTVGATVMLCLRFFNNDHLGRHVQFLFNFFKKSRFFEICQETSSKIPGCRYSRFDNFFRKIETLLHS